MELKKMIQVSLDKIETNLDSSFLIDQLATSCYFSRYHYQRLFRQIVGESVMEYVKKRRLTLAAAELCQTKQPILDIAIKYGYNSHESFTRAFRRFHGLSPSDCRRYGVFRTFEKLTLEKESSFMENKIYSPHSLDEVLCSFDQFIFDTNKLGHTLADLAQKESMSNFTVLAERYFDLSNKFQKSMDSIKKLEQGFDASLKRIQLIKMVEDATFHSNIIALNTNLQIYRTLLPQRDIFLESGKEASRIATQAGTLSKQILLLFQELCELIQTDAQQEAAQISLQILDQIRENQTQLEIITKSIQSTAVTAGRNQKSFLIIAEELHFISEELQTLIQESTISQPISKKELMKWSEHMGDSIHYLDDVSTRLNLLTFDSLLESKRSMNKNMDTVIESLSTFTKSMETLPTKFHISLNDIDKLLNLFPTTPLVTGHDTQKMLKDILFQHSILYFYVKTECAHIESFPPLATGQNLAFMEKIKSTICCEISAIHKMLDNNTALSPTMTHCIYSNLLDISQQVKNLCLHLGDQGAVFDYLATEYSHFADRFLHFEQTVG